MTRCAARRRVAAAWSTRRASPRGRAARGVVALLIDRSICSARWSTRSAAAAEPLLLTAFHCVRSLVEQRIAGPPRARRRPEGARRAAGERGQRNGSVGGGVAGLPGWCRCMRCSTGRARGAAPQPPRAGGARPESVYGATPAAYANDSDFALPELEEMPPPWYGAYLNGWAAHAAPPNRTAVIHHPSGDLKKVSLDFDPPEEAYYSNDAAAAGCGARRAPLLAPPRLARRPLRGGSTRGRLVGRAAL